VATRHPKQKALAAVHSDVGMFAAKGAAGAKQDEAAMTGMSEKGAGIDLRLTKYEQLQGRMELMNKAYEQQIQYNQTLAEYQIRFNDDAAGYVQTLERSNESYQKQLDNLDKVLAMKKDIDASDLNKYKENGKIMNDEKLIFSSRN
jgi:hypothetical protein